jgi:hypothetical protein
MKLPKKSLPLRASVQVLAASYKAALSSVMLYFFLSFFDTIYIAAAPAYLTTSFCPKLKFPAYGGKYLHKLLLVSDFLE